MAFANELAANGNVFLEDPERRLKLGWYLREAGPRWTSIQLLSSCFEYCEKIEGQVRADNVDME